MSEDLGTKPISEDREGPDPAGVKPGSEQVVGDDETEYGGAGASPEPDTERGQRGPREEDEDQGI